MATNSFLGNNKTFLFVQAEGRHGDFVHAGYDSDREQDIFIGYIQIHPASSFVTIQISIAANVDCKQGAKVICQEKANLFIEDGVLCREIVLYIPVSDKIAKLFFYKCQ